MTANTIEIKSTIKYFKPLEIEELLSNELSLSHLSDDNFERQPSSTTSKCSEKYSGKWSSSIDECNDEAFFEENKMTHKEEEILYIRKIYNKYIGDNIKKFCFIA